MIRFRGNWKDKVADAFFWVGVACLAAVLCPLAVVLVSLLFVWG